MGDLQSNLLPTDRRTVGNAPARIVGLTETSLSAGGPLRKPSCINRGSWGGFLSSMVFCENSDPADPAAGAFEMSMQQRYDQSRRPETRRHATRRRRTAPAPGRERIPAGSPGADWNGSLEGRAGL